MVRFRIECDLPFSRQDFWRMRSTPTFLDFVVSDGLLKKMSASPVEQDEHGWDTRIQHYCPAHVDCPAMIRTVVGDTMFAVDDFQRWNDDIAPFRLEFFIRPSFLTNLSKTSGLLLVEDHPDLRASGHAVRNSFAESSFDNAESDNAMSATAIDETTTSTSHATPPADTTRDDHLSSTDGSIDVNASDEGESTDVSDAESGKDHFDADAFLSALPPSEKSCHVVEGETRVSILTVGWFVERAIVHNLRNFYKLYPATVIRFRQKLYRDFADGDETVPCSVVVERFLESESKRFDKPRESQEEVRPAEYTFETEQTDLDSDDNSDNDLLCVE